MRSELPPSVEEITAFGIPLILEVGDPELIELMAKLGGASDSIRKKISHLERLEIERDPFIRETDWISRWVQFEMVELGMRKLVLSSREDLKWVIWKIGTLMSKVEIHENGQEYGGTKVWRDRNGNEFETRFQVDNPRVTITNNDLQCVRRPFIGEIVRSGSINCSYQDALSASSGRLLIKGCFLDHFKEHVEGLKRAAR